MGESAFLCSEGEQQLCSAYELVEAHAKILQGGLREHLYGVAACQAGGLMFYGPSQMEAYRQAGLYPAAY
jgi:hypothetical protein